MIVADENLNNFIINSLRDNGIAVMAINEEYKGIEDREVIEIARQNDKIILTEDKDFGEWVFSHRVKNISVIFLRYHFKDLQEVIQALHSVISDHTIELKGYFTTITPKKIRRREI